MSHSYLYRAVVTRYPDGSQQPIDAHQPGDDPEEMTWVPVPGWKPEGWEPPYNWDPSAEFYWPKVREYKSRSSAKLRAKMLESFGATVIIERSSKITWPESVVSE